MSKREPSEGFVPLDFTAAVDVDERIAACPERFCVRGMFFQEIFDAAERAGRPFEAPPRRIPWRHYPTREYMRVIADGAARVHPDLPLGEAMFQVAKQVYPNFADTMVGKAIFAIAGREFVRVAQLAPRAYDASLDGGRVEVRTAEPGYVHVHMADLRPFPELFQPGVWAGAMQVCGVEGELFVKKHDDANVELEILWDA